MDRIKTEINNYIEWMKQQEFLGKVGNSIYTKGYLDAMDDISRAIIDIENEPKLINKELIR